MDVGRHGVETYADKYKMIMLHGIWLLVYCVNNDI